MVATALSSDRFFESDREWKCHNQHQYKKKVPSSLAEEAPVGPSNLDRFLEATKPKVPARYLSKVWFAFSFNLSPQLYTFNCIFVH